MKTGVIALAAFAASAVSAQAVGLDRSGQPIGILFETGNHVELSFGFTNPGVDGTDLATTATIENVADQYLTWAGGIKYQLNDKLSFALSIDEPYGSDVTYPGNPAFTSLGGTSAVVDSHAFSALARYKFSDNWSVHGGLRYQEISANIALGGGAYGPLSGYNASFSSDGDVGYALGAAYEIPAIALRVALTYNSSTTHSLATVETGITGAGTVVSQTEVDTPESLNLAFQTGIAANTLLFGNIRYARYSQTVVAPVGFFGASGSALSDLDDGYDFAIGFGRRFNEKWSGSVSVGFTTVGDDNLVSPLSPSNGSRFLSVGAKYDVNDAFAISGGVRYTMLGDAFPETGTPDEPRGEFSENDAISVGFKLAYKF